MKHFLLILLTSLCGCVFEAAAQFPGTISFETTPDSTTSGGTIYYGTREDAGPFLLHVSRSPDLPGTVTVSYQTTGGGNAEPNIDYTPVGGVLTFAPGEFDKTISIPILNDTETEVDKGFVVMLSNPSAGDLFFGAAVIFITSDDPPANDAFAAAQVITGSRGLVNGFLVSSTIEPQEPILVLGYPTDRSVWYRWTAPSSGKVILEAGAALSIFIGTTLADLSEVASAYNSVSFDITADTTYFIRVADSTFNYGNGQFTLTWLIPNPKGSFRLLTNGGIPGGDISIDEDPTIFGDAVYDVERVGGSQGTVSVRFSTGTGTATPGSDYTPVSTVLTFAPGETLKSVTVPMLQDMVVEPDETIPVQLSDPTGGADLFIPATGTIVIISEDQPGSIGFQDTSELSVDESGAYAVMAVTREDGTAGTVTVSYRNVAGTATAGADFTARTGSITFLPGQTFRSIAIPILDDTALEGDETFMVELSNPTGGATLRAANTKSIRIVSDESVGTFSAFGSPSFVSEQGGSATFQVTRDNGSLGTASVSYQTQAGDAQPGSDFTAVSGTLTFQPGEISKTVTVPILNDGVPEGEEYFRLVLSNPTGGATLGFDTADTYIQSDDESPGGLSIQSTQVSETAGTVTLQVQRSNGTVGAVSVDFMTMAGSADANDFTPTSGTISFAAGEFAPKSIVIPIINDALIEDAEYFTVELSNATGGAWLENAQAQVTIVSEEGPSNDNLANAELISGASGNVTGSILGATVEGRIEDDPDTGIFRPLVWYRWVAPTTGTVEFFLPPPGPGLDPGSVAIFRGSTYGNLRQLTDFASRVVLPVSIGSAYFIGVGGDPAQPDFQLRWQLSTNGALELAGTQTIFDDVNFVTIRRYIANEEDSGISVPIRRTGTPNGTVSVTLKARMDPDFPSALEDNDFTAVETVVMFGPGETEKSVNIPITLDAEEEDTETFLVQLSAPTGGAILGNVSSAPVFIFDATMDPPNDDFAAATPLFGSSGQRTGTLLGADPEQSEPSIVNGLGSTIWYRWAPLKSGAATIQSVFGTDFEGGESPLVELFAQENGALSLVKSNVTTEDDGAGGVRRIYSSLLEFAIEAGRTYYIRVDQPKDGFGSDDISLRWAIDLGTASQSPQIGFSLVNFEAREGSASLVVSIDRTGPLDDFASVDFSTADIADATADQDYRDVATTITFSPGETIKKVSVPLLDDSSLETSETFSLILRNPAGAALRNPDPVEDPPAATAIATILDDDNIPPNDDFAHRVVLLDEAGIEQGSTDGASLEALEPTEPLESLHAHASVWYEWTAPALEGVATFAANVGGFTGIIIYNGTALDRLTPVASGFFSVSFVPVQGTTYVIAVTSVEDELGLYTGPFELTYQLDPAASLIHVDPTSFRASEAAGNLALLLTRSGSTAGPASVTVSSTVGDYSPLPTAQPEDFTELTQVVTFQPGQSSATVNIPLVNDALGEGDERFQVSLSDPGPKTIIDGAFDDGTGSVLLTFTATILDDDDDPAPPDNDAFVAAAVISGSFGSIPGTNIGATIEAGEPADTQFRTVWYRWTAPASGPVIFAADAVDTRSVTFYAGTSLANLVELDSLTGDNFIAVAGTTYYIAVGTYGQAGDNPGYVESDFVLNYHMVTGGVLALAAGPAIGAEPDGNVVLTVERTGATAGTVSVRLVSSDESATAGSDYVAVDTVLTFGPGEITKTLSISLINDQAREGTETFSVDFAETTGDVLLGNAGIRVTIDDDDDDPRNDDFADSLALSGPFGTTAISNLGSGPQPIEPAFGGSHTVWQRWTAPADGTVTFRADGDGFDPILAVYRGATLTGLSEVAATRASGNQFCTLEFPVTAGSEYRVVMDGVGTQTGNAILSWTMKIPGRLQFSTPLNLTVMESGGSVLLTVTRSTGSDGAVGVHYAAINGTAVVGTDFTATEGDMAFADGETSKNITIPILDNSAFETAESFTVVLTAPTGGATLGANDTTTIRIANDDTFAPRLANYAALVNPRGPHEHSGLLRLSVSTAGSFTGQMVLGGLKYQLKGIVDALGAANVPLLRKGRTPIAVALQVSDGGSTVSGEVYDETFRVPFAGESSFYDGKTKVAPQAGTYNVVFEPTSASESVPQGIGMTSWKVSPAGSVTIKAGVLADNTPLNATGFITESGHVVLYSLLYKGAGSFAGEISFRDETLTDADGQLAWLKPPKVGQKFYAGGFTTEVKCSASRYAKPAAGLRILPGLDSNNGEADVTLSAGNLGTALNAHITAGVDNRVTVALPNASALTFTATAATGRFKGTFQPPGGRKTSFNGIFLPKSDRGFGLFFGSTESGSVDVIPHP
jgi:hypothetical protein